MLERCLGWGNVPGIRLAVDDVARHSAVCGDARGQEAEVEEGRQHHGDLLQMDHFV